MGVDAKAMVLVGLSVSGGPQAQRDASGDMGEVLVGGEQGEFMGEG
jgi:hypothetical protein